MPFVDLINKEPFALRILVTSYRSMRYSVCYSPTPVLPTSLFRDPRPGTTLAHDRHFVSHPPGKLLHLNHKLSAES